MVAWRHFCNGRRQGDLRQAVLVGVADLLEDGGGSLGHGGLAVAHGVQAELVLDDVGDGLGVGGGA